MSELPAGADPDTVKAMAKADADALSRVEEAILPETWELNRWMLATLVGLNGAGAAAVYSAATMDTSVKVWLYRWFGYGALAALASGLTLAIVLSLQSATTIRAQRYWRAVAHDGIRSPQSEAKLRASAKRSQQLASIPQLFLFASAGIFLWTIYHLA
jgi:hypothetical protein